MPNPKSCTHIKVTGARCDSPALRGEQFCYFHQHAHRGVRRPARSRLHPIALIESEEAIQAILTVLGGNFQMILGDALFGSTHPDREYTFFHSSNALPVGQLATNFARVKNDKVDEGMDAARTTDDPAEQSEDWGEVQEGWAEENAYIFLVHVQVGSIAADNVHGVAEYTFPDGTVGLPQEQNVVALYPIWLS